MRTSFVILLTVMLALASSASAAHATPHGQVSAPVMADGASEMTMHAAMSAQAAASAEATASCCAGEVQRGAPSCPVFLAVLPANPSMSQPVHRPLVFAVATAAGESLDPERLLDPPRP